MDSGHYGEQSWMDDQGSRCVVEANWVDPSARCQMIWDRDRSGGCVITTCNKAVPAIRLTRDQAVSLAYWLRQVPDTGVDDPGPGAGPASNG